MENDCSKGIFLVWRRNCANQLLNRRCFWSWDNKERMSSIRYYERLRRECCSS